MKFHCASNPNFYLRSRGVDVRFSGGYYETDDSAEIKALRKAPGVEEVEEFATGGVVSGDPVPTVIPAGTPIINRGELRDFAEGVRDSASGEDTPPVQDADFEPVEPRDGEPGSTITTLGFADLTRSELDELARGEGIDPTDFRVKADLIAALEELEGS